MARVILAISFLLAWSPGVRADSAPTPAASPAAAGSAAGSAAAGSAAGSAAATPPASPVPPLPSWVERIPWVPILIVLVVLVVLAVAIWLIVRWRRRRAEAAPTTDPGPDRQLAAAWRPFYRRLPARARHFPTVIVMGDAGAGKSQLINARLDWRGQANQFFPSSVDSPHLQLYLGSELIVHELAAPLLRDTHRRARRALVRLWRNLGPSATIVVVVDARTLATTPPDNLRELGELVRGKIGALPARCRAGVAVRVCLSHLDQLEGYDELAAVLGAHHGALDVRALGDRLTDARAVSAAARALVASLDGNLAYGLTHRSSDGFARLVSFYSAFPVVLTQLAPLLHTLTGESADHPHYPPSGLCLSALAPENHVGDPFVVDSDLVAHSIAHQRRFHRRASALTAALGAVLVSALMLQHYGKVITAQHAVAEYHARAAATHGRSDHQALEVASAIEDMYDSEHLWLGETFVEHKRKIEVQFANHLRRQYIIPKLKVETVNRSTMLYIVSLLYASDGNGLRALIDDNVELWATRLDLSSDLVSSYLHVSHNGYARAESFDNVAYTGSDWQGYVFERIKPLYEQPQPISQDQLTDLTHDVPILYDSREYAVRRSVLDILTVDPALSAQLSIQALLDSPLARSEWVEANAAALHGIKSTMDGNQLTTATPHTLNELGTALERMLAAPASGREVYRLSRVKDGNPETLDLDVAKWKHKLAVASAVVTIASVCARGAQAEPTIGFFAPDTVSSEAIFEGGSQGPTSRLPAMYTAAMFAQEVAPALDFISKRAASLDLPKDALAQLDQLYQAQINDYAAHYADALRSYYASFRFDPGSEDALPFTLTTMMQPSSWYLRFLTTVATNAAPTLGDGKYYQAMADSLQDFRALADLLAPAKGTIPGLAWYQQLINQLATALAPTPPDAAAGSDSGPPGLTTTLSPDAVLTLGKLNGTNKDKLAQINGWLTGASVPASQALPFLAPVQAAYNFGLHDLNTAVSQAWSSEMAPAIDPLLTHFPFRTGANDDVAVADLEAMVRAQGKQPGTFWVRFASWLAPVTVAHDGRYQWLGNITGPAGTLDEINALARLSRALWDNDGNPIALPIDVTPQPLDATPVAGRVPTLASLLAGSAAVYAFNQRPRPSTLALPWWDQGASSVMVRLTRPGTSDTVSYSIDESGSTFSFYRLLCRAHTANRSVPKTCNGPHGSLVWDVPLGGSSTRPITFTLNTDPWALFHIAH
jgi:type VI secretion system protein ImpL